MSILFSFCASGSKIDPSTLCHFYGSKNSALYLVARSNIEHIDSNRNNALYYASKHLLLLQALLKKSHAFGFVNQQNVAGCTALHHAIELDQADAALLLLQNGADPFIPDNTGKIPSILACEKNFVEVIAYVQQHDRDHITSELQKQVASATQAAANRRSQAFQK